MSRFTLMAPWRLPGHTTISWTLRRRPVEYRRDRVAKFTGNLANAATVTILSDVPVGTRVYTAGGNMGLSLKPTRHNDNDERDREELYPRTACPVQDPTTIDMTLPDKATRAGKVFWFWFNRQPRSNTTGHWCSGQCVWPVRWCAPTASVLRPAARLLLPIPAGLPGPLNTGAAVKWAAASVAGQCERKHFVSWGIVTAAVSNAGSSSVSLNFTFGIPTGATELLTPRRKAAGTGSGDMNDLSDDLTPNWETWMSWRTISSAVVTETQTFCPTVWQVNFDGDGSSGGVTYQMAQYPAWAPQSRTN